MRRFANAQCLRFFPEVIPRSRANPPEPGPHDSMIRIIRQDLLVPLNFDQAQGKEHFPRLSDNTTQPGSGRPVTVVEEAVFGHLHGNSRAALHTAGEGFDQRTEQRPRINPDMLIKASIFLKEKDGVNVWWELRDGNGPPGWSLVVQRVVITAGDFPLVVRKGLVQQPVCPWEDPKRAPGAILGTRCVDTTELERLPEPFGLKPTVPEVGVSRRTEEAQAEQQRAHKGADILP